MIVAAFGVYRGCRLPTTAAFLVIIVVVHFISSSLAVRQNTVLAEWTATVQV